MTCAILSPPTPFCCCFYLYFVAPTTFLSHIRRKSPYLFPSVRIPERLRRVPMKSKSSTENSQPNRDAPTPEREDFAPTRSSLVHKLRAWDDYESWQLFFDTYWKLIYTVATRAGLSDSEAQEVVQETVITVAKAVKDFTYDRSKGKFRGWLTQKASWRIKDQFRKRARVQGCGHQGGGGNDEARTDEIDALPDPKDALGQLWQEEWDRKIREVVIRRVKEIVSPKQFQIFDCYVLKGWPVLRVVQELGVSEARVYIARTRVSHIVKEEMARVENGLI